MPDLSKTLIVIVLDRSGSMHPVAQDMEASLEAFIEEQKKVAGSATVSLYQFNHRCDVMFENKPLDDVPEIRIRPNGITALMDALGRTIDTVGEQLAVMKEAERPGSVVMLIITDGFENASTKFTRTRIKEMVQHQTAKYSWQFAYLGSDPSTFLEASGIGIRGSSYQKSAAGIRGMAVGLSVSVDSYRRSRGQGKLDATLEIDRNLRPVDPTTSGS